MFESLLLHEAVHPSLPFHVTIHIVTHDFPIGEMAERWLAARSRRRRRRPPEKPRPPASRARPRSLASLPWIPDRISGPKPFEVEHDPASTRPYALALATFAE